MKVASHGERFGTEDSAAGNATANWSLTHSVRRHNISIRSEKSIMIVTNEANPSQNGPVTMPDE